VDSTPVAYTVEPNTVER